MCGWQYVGWDHISQGAPYHYATAQVEQRCLQLYMQMEQVDQRRAQDVQEVEEVEGRHWWTRETCTGHVIYKDIYIGGASHRGFGLGPPTR